jgi:hypothetical protein
MNEIELQRKLKVLFSDPAKRHNTVSGKNIQILSIGELNTHDGPDFKNAAVMLEGNIAVGDIEYHINENDWYNHSHDTDDNFKNVILHIVSNKSKSQKDTGLETLEVDIKTLESIDSGSYKAAKPENYEDIQHFALVRLLRKSSEAFTILKEKNLEEALREEISIFIERYQKRRRRPVYTDQKLSELPQKISNSDTARVLKAVATNQEIDIVSSLQSLIVKPIAGEGDHLRREIVLNCVLPLAVCLSEETARLDIFIWYWSAEALNSYGVLSKKYPGYSQKYLWQQQGLLEFQRMYGNKKNIVSESLENYGFAKVLDFYKFGSTDFEDVLSTGADL